MKISVLGTTQDQWSNALLSRIPKDAKKRTLILVGAQKQLITPLARIIGYRIFWIGDSNKHNSIVSTLLKLTSSITTNILVPNQKAEAKYLRMKINSKKISLTYPDTLLIQPNNSHSDSLIIACDGSISIEHGLGTTIKAIALAEEILGNIKLIIGGSIIERVGVEWLLQELNIKKISQFIPSTTHTWCEPCDLYIALDKSDNNLPLSLAQAMSFGKAIIATEKLELHEFIQNDKNGILLKDANADELSQTIINLARKPEQMQEFGNNNYKFAKEKFSEEVIQEKIKYIFN